MSVPRAFTVRRGSHPARSAAADFIEKEEDRFQIRSQRFVGRAVNLVAHAGNDDQAAPGAPGDELFLGRGRYQGVLSGLEEEHRDRNLFRLRRAHREVSGVDGFPA